MSIFSLFDDTPLPGDKNHRQLKNNILEYETFRQDAEGEEIFLKKPKNLWIPYALCILVLGILLAQLLRLQIAQGAFNRLLAEGNRLRSREVAAPRGLIYDAQGKVLAKNKASYDLALYPLDLPRNRQEREKFLETLSGIIQIPYPEIVDKVNQRGISSYDPIILKENIDRDTALLLQVKTINLPGVVIIKRPVREYADYQGLGHILGFVGKMTEEDLKENPGYKPFYEIGKEGIEASYETYLRGNPGILEIEIDSRGREQREVKETLPDPGHNLTLSLDAELEDVLTKSLGAEVRALHTTGGAAVAINPQTGEILALTSFPTYDNNLFTRLTSKEEYEALLSDANRPLFNRAIAGTYPSGSTIKPVIAAAGLQEGVITANTTINDPGEIKIGNYIYPDWKAHGLVDVRKAIAVSCNVFFYSVAGGWDKIKGLGIAKVDEYLKKFGFGSQTGIDLPGEAAGLVPDPAWKEKNKHEMWYLGDTYHLGIGQGDFLVTPLQLATAYAAIANGGELLKPHLVTKITDQDGREIFVAKKEIIRDNFVDKANIQIVREGMREAVTSGSAQLLNGLPVAVAAKTGTAQFGAEGKTHGWEAAFAPYNNPQIVIIVLIEGGGEGYSSAGPVVRDVLNWYFSRK
jgi:penicillin-binding protein 2